MKTAIKISLSDVGGDQQWYFYDSRTKKIVEKAPFNQITDEFPISSDTDGEGIIYNENNGNKCFAYYPNKEEAVNGATYNAIISDSSKLEQKRAVDFIGSKPGWVKQGITKETLHKELPVSWLIYKPKKKKVISKKLVADIIDNLLTALIENRRASIALIGKKLDDCQNALIQVLHMLPVSIANRITFNTNAGNGIGTIDLYCTTGKKDNPNGVCFADIDEGVFTDLSKDDGEGKGKVKYVNTYAEYVALTEKDLCDLEADSVQKLNHDAAIELFKNFTFSQYNFDQDLKKVIRYYESYKEYELKNKPSLSEFEAKLMFLDSIPLDNDLPKNVKILLLNDDFIGHDVLGDNIKSKEVKADHQTILEYIDNIRAQKEADSENDTTEQMVKSFNIRFEKHINELPYSRGKWIKDCNVDRGLHKKIKAFNVYGTQMPIILSAFAMFVLFTCIFLAIDFSFDRFIYPYVSGSMIGDCFIWFEIVLAFAFILIIFTLLFVYSAGLYKKNNVITSRSRAKELIKRVLNLGVLALIVWLDAVQLCFLFF